MESKLIKVCENLLFTDNKITTQKFKKELRKKNIQIIHSISERIIAFLQSLPKNLALFQALKPTFKYILQDQFNLTEDEQRYVFLTEKLQNKPHLEDYELAAGTQMFINYPDMFNKKFLKKLHKEEKIVKLCDKERLFPLITYFSDLWYDYYDKKELNCCIKFKNGHIIIFYHDSKNFKEMYEEIMDLACSLPTYNLEVDEEESYILFNN